MTDLLRWACETREKMTRDHVFFLVVVAELAWTTFAHRKTRFRPPDLVTPIFIYAALCKEHVSLSWASTSSMLSHKPSHIQRVLSAERSHNLHHTRV